MELLFERKSASCEHSDTVGNYNLISDDEREIADFLRDRNLAKVNAASQPVHPRNSFYTLIGKRILDIVISAVVLLITLPLNGIFAVCTYFDVGRPILYKQTRTGKDGKPFVMVKFRNMNEKRDENGNLLPASQRVTKFGYFMRKYSLDELLNFWNVLKGDMSIIGPRPLPAFFEERMSERHKMRHAVRPGLECPRIISLEEKDICQYQLQFENDIWYAENVSFLTDIKMIFRLVKMVFSAKYRSMGAASGSYFVGYDDQGIATSVRKFKQEFLKSESF